jgi:uroporphyrinogen decarboxylase
MTSRELWERDYRPHLLAVNRDRLDLPGTRAEFELRRAQGLWTYYQQGLLWQHMSSGVGLITFLEKLIEDPDWIHDFNRVHVDFYKAHFNILFDEVGIPDGVRLIDDFAFSGGLLSSPRVMRELYLPYYKEMVDFFHARGMLVQIHVCGGVTAAVPMLVEAGIDILDPLEFKAGVDPLALTETYGHQLAFVGGMDIRVLESGDRAAIKREVVRLTRGMIERGGRYVWGSDHSVPPTVGYQDYLYAVQTCREYGAY